MIDFGQIRTLRDEAEYEAALAAVRPYFEDEPDPRTPESENFDALVLLIEDYEAKHYPMPDAPPVALILHGACRRAGQSPDPGGRRLLAKREEG